MAHTLQMQIYTSIVVLMLWSTVAWMATYEIYRHFDVPFIRVSADTLAAFIFALIAHKQMLAIAPAVVLGTYLSFLRPHFMTSSSQRSMKIELFASYLLVIILVLEHFL